MTRKLFAALFTTGVVFLLTVRADDPAAKSDEPKKPDAPPAISQDDAAAKEKILREDFENFKNEVLKLKQRLETSDKEEDKQTVKVLDSVLKEINDLAVDGKFDKVIEELQKQGSLASIPDVTQVASGNKELHDAMEKLIDLLQNGDDFKKKRQEIESAQKLLERLRELQSKQERLITVIERNQKTGKEFARSEEKINQDIKGILDPNAKETKPSFNKSEAKYDNKPGADARGEAKNDTQGPKGESKDDKTGDNKDGKPGDDKAGDKKDDMKPGDGKEGDNKDGMKPSDGKGGDNKDGMKPGESKDGDKGGEAKEGDKPSEGKEAKGGENKDAKPGEGKDANSKAGNNDNKEGKPGENKDGESKDGKAGDGKDGPKPQGPPSESKDGKGGEAKESKPGDGKQGEPKDGKPSEGKSGEPKDGAQSGEPKDGKGGESKDGKPGEGKQGVQAKPSDAKGGESKDGKPGDGKEAAKADPNGKPGDGKQGGQPGEGPKAGDKPGDGKEAGKPGDGKPGDPKAGDGQANSKPGEGKGNEPKAGAGSEGGKQGQGKEGGKPGDGKTGKPGDGKESKPGDGKAGDGKQGESKDGKPGDGKAGDGKPAESKSGSDQKGQGDGKGEAKAGDPKAGQSPDAKPSESKGSQQSGQPGQQGQQSQQSQGKGDPSSGGDSAQPPPPPQGPQPHMPVRKQIEDGVKDSQETKEKLDQEDKQGATPPANKTAEDLQKAIKKLEEIINADRQEEIERILERLQARCARMLAMQIAVRDGTSKLDEKLQEIRKNKGDERAAAQDSNVLSDREYDIVKEADRALALLENDGSAVAFAEMFQMVRKDMLTVKDRLGQTDTGVVTVAVEDQIIKNLSDMVDALKKQREANKNKGPQQPKPPGQKKQQAGEDPLVDAIAQLKLLRSMQKGLNDRTELYSKEYSGEQAPAPGDGKDAKERQHYEMIQKEMKELAETEAKISKVLKDMLTGKNRVD